MKEIDDQKPSASVNRYDLLLLLIPVAFLLSLGIATATGLSLHIAGGLASLFGGIVLADCMFINPPVEVSPNDG